jgi:hypothetical protein
MPFPVVDDEALDPVGVSLLGPDAVMSAANHISDLIEQFGFVWRRDTGYVGRHANDSRFPPDKLKPD